MRVEALDMVRVTGLEPARRGHQILSLACLPIPPHPHILFFYSSGFLRFFLPFGTPPCDVCGARNLTLGSNPFAGQLSTAAPSKFSLLLLRSARLQTANSTTPAYFVFLFKRLFTFLPSFSTRHRVTF